MYYPFTKVIIHYFLTQDKTLFCRNKIGMHTSKDDYLINTLRFVSAKEETQIYGAILPDSLTSPEMKETKAYKTYIDFDLDPTRKSKRVKRPEKKTTKAPARGVVIRETLEIPVSKKKEKVDVTRGKGIELLSQVALTEDAQFKEVRRKIMRDFHKTYPSGSDTATKPTPSAAIIKPFGNGEDDSNNDQDFGSEGSDQEKDSDDDKTQSDNENESDTDHETNEFGSESNQEEDEEKIEDDEEEEEEEEIVKTPSNDSDDKDETKVADKVEGDEDEEMDYTTILLYDDMDIRLNKPVDTDKGFKTEVLVSSSSHLSDLAAKFLNFLDIPTIEAEIVSPLDIHVHHEVPSQQTPILLTVHVSVISKSSPVISTVIPQSLQSFTPPPLLSTPTPPPTTEATNPPSTLPDFVSVFQFNTRVTTLEQEVAELKKDHLHTQVMALDMNI
ncbi:hypothetical protein Tco_0653786 [Tanacetum coccineum]|uniref:Uncharacterized protein n=1 Tax=Tanacetum coccineum TaxID=301880 RepID=A0ABQ4X1L6_9ASTR